MTSQIMGVVNVTPDSFFDGGRYFDHEAAIAHGRSLICEGADVIDVGGESTRPGAMAVDDDEEMRRVLPVVAELAREVRVSIDTSKARVAEAAIEAGATLINDVSSSLVDVASAHQVGIILMHMRGTPRDMQRNPIYDNVVAEVRTYLQEVACRAHDAGVEEVYVDPGIGFGKTLDHNVALLRALPELVNDFGPIVVGTSRKSFLGRLVSDHGDTAPVDERFEGSLATAVWAMAAGAAIVRVHDVKATVDARRLVGEVVDEDGRMATALSGSSR